MPTLVLVDGSSYLYRAFHALPDLRTSQGEPTGALRGVLAMLRRMVEDGKPDYFAVVFDAPGKTFRDDWYPEYKAHRPPMPDDLLRQLEPLKELVRANGWPLLVVDGVEADDVIGTLAKAAKRTGIDTLISTSDKDLAQLVEPGVTCVNTMSNETLDTAGVVAKFGVRPDQVLDLLALTGDAVDNVPGVPKVGPKTAAKWLAQYGTLDNIVANASDIGGVVGENLRASLDWLPQGRRLLTVKTDCDLPVGPRDLAIAAVDRAKLAELYARFEFKSWLRDLAPGATPAASVADAIAAKAARDDTGRRFDAPVHAGGDGKPADLAYETVLTSDALERWIADLDAAALACFDTETTSLDPMGNEIVGLSFCILPGRACYVPLAHRYAGAPDQLDRAAVLARLAPWFASARHAKVGQNVKFDQHALANHGVALAGVAHDTLLESYVLESHKPHDMDSLAWRHLGWKTIAYADVCGKGASQIGFDQVSVEHATGYSAEDADVTLRLHRHLHPQLAADAKLERLYREIEMPVRDVLFRMERHGVLVDAALLARQGGELAGRILELEHQAHALAGQPFNLGSPKQLGEILFTRMKLPVTKKTGTGQPSTDEEVLQELAADYPLPKVLLEHRALAKLKSTYTDKLPQMIDRRTGRVHTTFGQATAVTGRLASNDPNLQNIPVRTAEGRRIREAFVAPAGHVIVSADYSQIELRIMAHLSGDPALTRAFHEGADIHRATAAEIFGVPATDVTSDQRRYIKAVNFGLIYGMGAFGLAQQLGIERGAAQQFIDKYFARYPGVADYMQRTRELAREQGYVETVFGRRLWLPDIKAAGGPRRAGAERAAINAPMQGTAADLVKLAMIAVDRWIADARLATRLVLQVHDELVLEVPEHELARVRSELPERMTSGTERRTGNGRTRIFVDAILEELLRHGVALVGLNVLLQQLGLPIPSVPTMMVAGALALDGRISGAGAFAISVAASVVADLLWFAGGRHFGYRVLKLLCRMSLSPDACVRQTEGIFERWGFYSLVVSKFVPGFSTVAPPMAGALRMRLPQFLLATVASAVLWVGAAMGAGALFRREIDWLLGWMSRHAALAGIALGALLALYVAYRAWQRWQLARHVEGAMIGTAELVARLASDAPPLVVDVGSRLAHQSRPHIPGALLLDLDAIDGRPDALAADRSIVFYCACPNEASAKRAAQILLARGHRDVRALTGGLDGWMAAGHPVEAGVEVSFVTPGDRRAA